MRNINKTFGQRGTLLMEAIAMLGLIAMVTPTLYKKSAERMQEIQDINIAGQARNMDNVINAFVLNNLSELKSDSQGIPRGGTIQLSFNDTNAHGYFYKGYSAYVPAGYNPKNLKNYGEPSIYVHRYNTDESSGAGADSFVYYIVYPNVQNTDEKRAARVASLVGSNGGTVVTRSGNKEVHGTGGGWGLDSSLTNYVGINDSALINNSLVITSQEPITTDKVDSDVFLYRVDDSDKAPYHNAMITSLYMGGIESDENNTQNQLNSIYNVRRLTLNTRCNQDKVRHEHDSALVKIGDECPANVADLYIGKPTGGPELTTDASIKEATGAAWIYGNLSALNHNFRLYNGDDPSTISYGAAVGDGQDSVLEFVRRDSTTADAVSVVLRAENKEGSTRVAMIDDFVQVEENGGSGQRRFMVGDSSAADAFIGVYEGSSTVRINSPDGGTEDGNRLTRINTAGGTVIIGDRGADSSVTSEVIINASGGVLQAGKSGSWIYANGDTENSSQVHILQEAGQGAQFTVGGKEKNNNYMWADSSVVSLSNRRLQIFDNYTDWGAVGGKDRVGTLMHESSITGSGVMAITAHYTDILGSTYMGTESLQNGSSVIGGPVNLNKWNLAVAGSAYVDSTLAANEAWFKSVGGKELHAGFSSYAEWKNGDSTKAMLNVYNDRLVVRNRGSNANDDIGDFGSSGSGAMMYVDSSQVRLQSTKGAALDLTDELAMFGSGKNRVEADSSKVIIHTENDSSYSVNIQDSAMVFTGHPGNMTNHPTNEIKAQAGLFSVQTRNDSQAYSSGTFYVDSSATVVRQVDFKVEQDGQHGSAQVFYVAPMNYEKYANADSSKGISKNGVATVNVNGTFHVNGNDVIHIASDEQNAAGVNGEKRAVLEVDSAHVQVLARDSSGAVTPTDILFKVNPYDVGGQATSSFTDDPTANVGVYVRRGAIELAKSDSSTIGLAAANAGTGYIMANRLVSNTGITVPARPDIEGFTSNAQQYDQYMVNPAYTSVMHDIKLTTRGGARLSDILPDYVLKGVYNLSNNCEEGTTSGVSCNNRGMNKWASPYVGIIPYASCPPGYINMTTLMPTSFNVGRAGRLEQETKNGISHWVVGAANRQADILRAGEYGTSNKHIRTPNMEEAHAYIFNDVYGDSSTFNFSSYTSSRIEGWFLGYKTTLDVDGNVKESMTIDSANVWYYTDSSGTFVVPEPLYFQQNTWLKTSVIPETGTDASGWNSYMGFIYDTANEWKNLVGGVSGNGSINNIFRQDETTSATGLAESDFVWNLFPVPINSIEGHAMVYCYFDRSKFETWKDNDGKPLVDQIDQLGSLKGEVGAPGFRKIGEKPDNDFTKRLNDPTLKYKDPW